MAYLRPGYWGRKYWGLDYWDINYWPGFQYKRSLPEAYKPSPEALDKKYKSLITLCLCIVANYKFTPGIIKKKIQEFIDEDLWLSEL